MAASTSLSPPIPAMHRTQLITQGKAEENNSQRTQQSWSELRLKPSPGGSVVKNLPANAGDVGSIPGSGKSPGVGNGNPLQCSCWEIPWTEELGRLQSMRSQRIRQDSATKQQTPRQTPHRIGGKPDMQRSCLAFPTSCRWKQPGFLTLAYCSFPAARGNNFPPRGNVNHSCLQQYWQPHKHRRRRRTCSGIFFFPVLWHGPLLPQCYCEETVGACLWRDLPTKAGGCQSWVETNTASLEIQLDSLKNGPHLTSITQMQGELTNYSL